MRNSFLAISSLALTAALVIASCDATNPVLSEGGNGAANSKSFNDGVQSRVLSVYLVLERDYSFIPVFDGRIVLAEPVYTVPGEMARGSAMVDGIEVVYLGESCESLLSRYQDLQGCAQEETAEFQYGGVESTATTDSDGIATLAPGDSEKYRIRVKSWVTAEDVKCFWGGSETIGIEDTEVSIPVSVFCE